MSSPASLSSVPHARLIAFDTAVIKRSPLQDSWFLRVVGASADEGFMPKLAPRIYRDRPDYWEIEVVAVRTPTPAGEADGARTTLSIPLIGITGTRGVKVVGNDVAIELDIAA